MQAVGLRLPSGVRALSWAAGDALAEQPSINDPRHHRSVGALSAHRTVSQPAHRVLLPTPRTLCPSAFSHRCARPARPFRRACRGVTTVCHRVSTRRHCDAAGRCSGGCDCDCVNTRHHTPQAQVYRVSDSESGLRIKHFPYSVSFTCPSCHGADRPHSTTSSGYFTRTTCRPVGNDTPQSGRGLRLAASVVSVSRLTLKSSYPSAARERRAEVLAPRAAPSGREPLPSPPQQQREQQQQQEQQQQRQRLRAAAPPAPAPRASRRARTPPPPPPPHRAA